MKIFRALVLSAVASICSLFFSVPVHASTITFFDSSQTGTKTAGITSDTVETEGYLFTYTLDKLFTGGTGTIIGRQELHKFPSVPSTPLGLHAQAVTTGTVGPAQITVRRVDGNVFDLNALTFKLLANTWATGADIEITPVVSNNEGPIVFLDASGVGGHSTFSYSPTLSDYRGFNTSSLVGYDTYNLSLFVDFALTGMTLVDAGPGGASPVPLPGSYAMLLAGLLLLVSFRCYKGQRAAICPNA
jgi:hypothetical protein